MGGPHRGAHPSAAPRGIPANFGGGILSLRGGGAGLVAGEQQLRELEEIDTLTSTSRLGISVIEVELKDTITNVDAAWSRVRDKASDAIPSLPTAATEPEVEVATISANALIVGLVWDLPGDPNYGVLSRLAETLQEDLRRIPGSKSVERFGEAEEEIRVEVDPVAVTQVVGRSTRHVVATTLTTLVGFIPLLLDATGFWPPLAICIAGGLGGTTILALYAVPSAHLLLNHSGKPRHR
nr:efflux RND transporter permease subunit [Thermostichus vulcanus]